MQRAALAAAEQSEFPASVRWDEHDVAQGDAGLALACAYFDRCFPDDGWDVAGHEYLVSASRSVEDAHVPPGLFSGLAGLAFVTAQLSRDGERYGRLAAAIETELAARTEELSQRVRERRNGLAVSEFDAISGLAGIAAYLLTRRGQRAADGAAQHALEALVALVREPGPGPRTPRWFTPPELFSHEEEARRYPRGSLNCGLAHGIPGPLAALALASAQGADVDGLRDAVAQTARWLARAPLRRPLGRQLADDGDAARRPPRRGRAEPRRVVLRQPRGWRAPCGWPAWRSRTTTLGALAVEAMERVYDRPVAARQIESPTFCHGVAGLLQVTLRFRHDTGLALFADAAADLVDELLDAFEPDDSLLGFRSIEPGGTRIDQPGLLDGAPGVALVLLAAALPVEPTWDRLFLLA